MNKDVVDIILTTYNRKRFLEKTIDAIKARTFYPHRLIVVDNNSDDGTKEYLLELEKAGKIDKAVLLDRNAGQADSQNEGLKFVETEYFVTTQDDLIPPDLRPCWLERLVHLFKKHYPDYGALCMRIQRTRRLPWDEREEIIENFKSIPSVFRIHKTSDWQGDRPFGNRKHWESQTCADFLNQKKMKFGMITWLYADHIGFMAYNKGYDDKKTDYYTFSTQRVNQGETKPFPTIDPKTNIPMEINHSTDKEEHSKRISFWGFSTGKQNSKEGLSEEKVKQREILAQYYKEGEKCLDLGCGEQKCSAGFTGVDTYPYDSADVLGQVDDLWWCKDKEIYSIVGSHILEHIKDTKKALIEWDRVLVEEGIIAMIVPDAEKRPNTILEPSHQIAFTSRILKRLFANFLGYEILRCGSVSEISERKASIIIVARKPKGHSDSKYVRRWKEAEKDLKKYIGF